ncbi:MAG: class I SAM-dependent methyltransferase [Saprospiraceae bacterium]
MSIQKSYNEWSAIYDGNENKTRDLDQMITRRELDPINFTRVLETGCGTGKNTLYLVNRSADVTALDFSEGMLAMAKAKKELSGVNFLQRDLLKDWEVGENQFDLVTCNLVLEHIEDLNPFFKKANKAMVSGGHLFISELHPFRQYKGSKAKYGSGEEEKELEVYIHHTSDFIYSALNNNFTLISLKEWFDENPSKPEPRLITFLFKKF